MDKKKIFFVIGSMNQTTQMHEISKHLPEYDCYFSQFFGNHPMLRFMAERGWMDKTIMGGKFRRDSDAYLEKHGLKNDFRGERYGNRYDLAVLCNDLVMPEIVRGTKTVWVQEGMIDQFTTLTKVVRALGLPRYMARGTSLNGASNMTDVLCVASEGYKEHFVRMGVPAHKILVTGIPNFDHIAQFKQNSFPHRDYVMVATSDIRETFGREDRPTFLRKCAQIAAGRPLLFKLHPNENVERATREIRENCPPDAMVFTEGSTNEMVANCAELITQWSTVVYVGIALGKPVHSWFPLDDLHRKTPIQNDGDSARRIADVCRRFLELDGPRECFIGQYRPDWSGQSAVPSRSMTAI
jgi:hypothetical protein